MSCTAQDDVTASPRTTRSTSVSERRPLVPVTPQRNNRAKGMRVASSPLTPSSSVISSPFTPITNVYSSSSSIGSPNSSVSTKVGYSPEPLKARRKSVADATQNWRSRAKENGITIHNNEITYADSLGLCSAKDTVPSSTYSTHRRPRQSLFPTNSMDVTAFTSPKTSHLFSHDGPASAPVPSSLASSVLNTPESIRSLSSSFTLATPSPRSSLAIVERLRQRGSATDPPRPRRRYMSGPILGETLFDIDEDSITSAPYSDTFGSPIALKVSDDKVTGKGKRCVSAPFIASRFYETYEDEEEDEEFEDDGLPTGPRTNRTRTQSVSSQPTAVSAENETDNNTCSVCSASSSPLSVLIPCEHLICSSCLTSSLNIVGEKDMRCAACEKPVEKFRLLTPLNIGVSFSEDKKDENGNNCSTEHVEQAMRLLPSAIADLSIKHDDNGTTKRQYHIDQVSQKATPSSASHLSSNDIGDVAVLRIDNVPWDVTPTSLTDFFSPYAIIRAHVLLDPKGKTLSHAYIEISAADARNALRSVQNKSLGKGRRLRGVTVTMSGQAELMRALFPSWLGGFEGMHPTLDGLDRATLVRALENGLITLSEIEGLLTLMKNPKSHFLKVPTLPFHSLVSVLSKFPIGDSRVFWSTKLRDILYETANVACDLLVERMHTELHDQDTLETVVATATNCFLFTDMQRFVLFTRIRDTISAKGGQLSCDTPNGSPSSLGLSDAPNTQDDNVSIASGTASSIHRGLKRRGLGFTDLAALQNINSLVCNGGLAVNGTLRSGYSGLSSLSSPHIMSTSPTVGFANANANIGMPFPLNGAAQAPYDMLAREFNVEPDLIAALAQRLAYAGQTMSPPPIGTFGYFNGGM